MKKRNKKTVKKETKDVQDINQQNPASKEKRDNEETLNLSTDTLSDIDNLNTTYKKEVNVADKEINNDKSKEPSIDTSTDETSNLKSESDSTDQANKDTKTTEKNTAINTEKKDDDNASFSDKDITIKPSVSAVDNSAEESDHTDDSSSENKLSKIAIAISIVAIGLTAAQFYFSYNVATQSINTKIATLEQSLSTDISNVATTANAVKNDASNVIAKANSNLESVNANLQALQTAAAQKSNDIDELQARLTKSIQQVEASGLKQNSRKDWLLAEVEYLLRLANQRVLMEKTPIGALALLESADQILKQTDDVSIFSVRKALAADITALAAVPNIDQEGIYLKIDALSGEINKLKLVPLTDKKRLPSILDGIATDAAQANEGNFSKVWNKITAKLEKLVVISHRDSAIEPLLSPAQQANLLQNLHILFEQAQLSLLQGKQSAYKSSLEKAQTIVSTYFQAEDPTTQGLLKGLQSLSKEIIATELPSIAGSLNALKAYLEQGASIKVNSATGVTN